MREQGGKRDKGETDCSTDRRKWATERKGKKVQTEKEWLSNGCKKMKIKKMKIR